MSSISSISLGAQLLPHGVTSNLGTVQASSSGPAIVLGVPTPQNTLGLVVGPLSRGTTPPPVVLPETVGVQLAGRPLGPAGPGFSIPQPSIQQAGLQFAAGGTGVQDAPAASGAGDGGAWKWSDTAPSATASTPPPGTGTSG